MVESQKKPPGLLRPWMVVFGLLLALVLAYGGYRFGLRQLVDAELELIRDAGLPATLEELEAWLPQVDPDENPADIYKRAFALILDGDAAEFLDHYDNLPFAGGHVELPPRDRPLPGEIRQAIAVYLAAHEEALRLLHEATNASGPARYVDHIEAGHLAVTVSLIDARRACNLLSLEAMEAIDRGENEAALRALAAGTALARSLEHEPSLIGHLIRMALEDIVVSSLETALSRLELSDTDLVRTGDTWNDADEVEILKRVFAGERALTYDAFAREDVVAYLLGLDPDTFEGAAQGFLYAASGVKDLDLRRYLAMMREALDALDLPAARRREAWRKIAAREDGFYHPVTRELRALLEDCLDLALAAMTRRRCLRTALAVERHRLRHDDLPETLEALAPEFLPAVPRDAVSGKPLAFRPFERGYVVYGLGPDGTDSGGVAPNARGILEAAGDDVPFAVRKAAR